MTFEDCASLATMHPLFDAILRAHGAPRKVTVKAHPDLSGVAPANCAWSAYDENTYDGAPDAGPKIVGWGATAEEALADYDRELAASNDTPTPIGARPS